MGAMTLRSDEKVMSSKSQHLDCNSFCQDGNQLSRSERGYLMIRSGVSSIEAANLVGNDDTSLHVDGNYSYLVSR